MSTQFIDGTFSQTKDFEEALEDFKLFVESGRAVSFHVGSNSEIEEAKKKANMSSRLEKLESMVDSLKSKEDIKNSNILEPTKEQIKLIEMTANKDK